MSIVLTDDPRLKVGAKIQKRITYVIVPDEELNHEIQGVDLTLSLDAARDYLTNPPNWQDWEIVAEAPDPDMEIILKMIAAQGYSASDGNLAWARRMLDVVREATAEVAA